MSKKKWEAPFARDLSAVRATGGLFTESLVQPFAACVNGTSVVSANCGTGSSVDPGGANCLPNGQGYGDVARCDTGTSAFQGCYSGSYNI